MISSQPLRGIDELFDDELLLRDDDPFSVVMGYPDPTKES
jgi:hypothetical protein